MCNLNNVPMRTILVFLLLMTTLGFVSCSDLDDSKYAEYLVARPIKMSVGEFKNSIDIISPVPMEESGKIYVYEDFIFVNDKYRGVHIIDNQNPSAPKKIGFIKIPGNVDISIKDNYLYADSITDLIVFDISDIGHIKIVNRLEHVLRDNII